MIPKSEIKKNRVLCLSWKSGSKSVSCKLGYIFQKGLFLVAIKKSAILSKKARKSRVLHVKINGNEQLCRPKVKDEFGFTKEFLKKQMELLMGKKLSHNSHFMQKLNDIAERHVVVELKPMK